MPRALLPSSFLPTERKARVWSTSPALSALCVAELPPSVAGREGRLPPSPVVSAGSLRRHQLVSLRRGCSSPSIAGSSSPSAVAARLSPSPAAHLPPSPPARHPPPRLLISLRRRLLVFLTASRLQLSLSRSEVSAKMVFLFPFSPPSIFLVGYWLLSD